MEFYYFGGNFTPVLNEIKKSKFTGVMFTYDAMQGDIFTRIVQQLKPDEKIKYLVAIRPYTMSPQYLCMINQSMNLIMGNRLQINFISGYTKDHEKDFGGIMGEVNDLSGSDKKSNYLIEYLNILNTMSGNKNSLYPLDFYVSTNNEFVEKVVNKYNNKIILPYKNYKNGYWEKINERKIEVTTNEPLNLNYNNVMLAITPILRKYQKQLDELPEEYAYRPVWRKNEKPHAVSDIEFFTYDEFSIFIKKLKEKGINQLLINAWPAREHAVIMHYIEKYTQSKELESERND
jgi:hypothetical protein